MTSRPMLPLGFSIVSTLLFAGLLVSTILWLPSTLVSAQGSSTTVAQFYRDGIVGRDVKGGGSVDIPDKTEWKPTTAMTIELWARPLQTYSASQDTIPHLISKQGPGYTGYSILYENRSTAGTDNGRFKGCVGLGARWECVSATHVPQTNFASGTWYHIVMVKSSGASGRIQLYLNGAKVGDDPSTTAISQGISMLRLGGYSLSTRYAFNGDLDEARIYHSALSDAEINDHYTKERFTIGMTDTAVLPTRCNRGSVYDAHYECQKADPAHVGEWATRFNTNPWIEQVFLPAATVGRIVLKDRANTTDNVLRGTVELSDGTRIPFATRLDPTGSASMIPVVPAKRNVSRVKVIIEGQEGSHVGLSELAVYSTLPGTSASWALSEADLQQIANEGNVFGFSRAEGCQEGETPPCGGQTYYGWIWMNCLNSINNEGTRTDHCPTNAAGQKVQARVIVCPLDDRGRTPSRYSSVPAESRLRECIGKNQGEVVGFAWGGGLGE